MSVVGIKAKEWNEFDERIDVITKNKTLIKFKSIYINFPELPVNDCDETHLNSSKGNVVFGGRPGLNVTTKKNIEKLMMNEPNFFSKPISIVQFLSLRFFTGFNN